MAARVQILLDLEITEQTDTEALRRLAHTVGLELPDRAPDIGARRRGLVADGEGDGDANGGAAAAGGEEAKN